MDERVLPLGAASEGRDCEIAALRTAIEGTKYQQNAEKSAFDGRVYDSIAACWRQNGRNYDSISDLVWPNGRNYVSNTDNQALAGSNPCRRSRIRASGSFSRRSRGETALPGRSRLRFAQRSRRGRVLSRRAATTSETVNGVGMPACASDAASLIGGDETPQRMSAWAVA
jgi:hypothetical protein